MRFSFDSCHFEISEIFSIDVEGKLVFPCVNQTEFGKASLGRVKTACQPLIERIDVAFIGS
jgi:hypothetical protein